MNILLSTGQQVGLILLIIAGLIVLGAGLFLLYHFVISGSVIIRIYFSL